MTITSRQLIAAVLCMASLSARAETSLATETKPDTKVHFADYMSYAGIGTYRTLDYFSTRRGLALGGQEKVLPQFVAESSTKLAVFEGLASAAEIAGSIWLIHHGHRRIARFENAVSIGLGSAIVAHNYSYGKAAGK